MEDNNSQEENSQNTVLPRENMITTAVHFLQNPRVQTSPLSQKRAFLQKKGLTDDEIDKAIEKASFGLLPSNNVANQGMQVQTYQGHVQQYQTPSFWIRVRDFWSSTIMLGLVLYGIMFVYRKYIEPLFGEKKEQIQLNNIEKALGELSSTVDVLKQNIQVVSETVQVSNKVAIKSNEEVVTPMEHISLVELKSEIASIKGLLLTRHQFPATPIPNPSIPSWQLPKTEETTNNAHSEDTEETENSDKSVLMNDKLLEGGDYTNENAVESV